MNFSWYPENSAELSDLLDGLMSNTKTSRKEIHGLIVPHAGYKYSGEVAGAAYSLLRFNPPKKAVVFGPSHYLYFTGIRSLRSISTPLGPAKIIENDFAKLDYDHSVDNQIPFLQKVNPNIEILPLVVGEISSEEAFDFAKKFSSLDAIFVFSTDLSHFLNYSNAVRVDRKTINIIENVNLSKWKNVDACGKFPLLIMFHMCKINNYKPRLVMYKNSAEVTGDKDEVVGYSSFVF